MRTARLAAALAVLLVALPINALAGNAPSPTRPIATGHSFWFPSLTGDDLSGVRESRSARTWVSGTPLLSTGLLQLDESGGTGEGDAGGRSMDLKLVGTHCKIYVDSGAKPYPTNNSLKALGNEFDDRIWPNDTETFGSIIYSSININVINMDGPYGIGGYFTPADPNSVYMDCADLGSWGNEILAHEFQHLIHYEKDPNEELWVNEGCADMAIAVNYGEADSTLGGHISAFEANPDNDLTVFQNEIYDYGSAYAFIQYFWDHFGGQASVRALVANKAHGIQGIDDTLQSLGYSQRFDDIFPDWAVANRLDDTSLGGGQFGYAQLYIHVDFAGDYTSLPVCSTASVQRWASDCYRFRGGNAQDLVAQFCSTTGSYVPRLFGQGSGVNSTVLNITLNSTGCGEAVLYSFGRDYSEAILFTPSSTGGDHDYSARMADRTPPITTATVYPPRPNGLGGWYTVAPTITIGSSEGLSRIAYWWDEPPELDYSGPLTAPEGKHTLWFFSADPSGNRDVNHTLELRVKTIPPVSYINVSPGEPDGMSGWYIHVPSIELSCDGNASLFYSWDGEPFLNYTSPLTATEGAHRLEYYSVDEAGNEGNSSERDFQVDTSVPTASAVLTPAMPDGLGSWYMTAPAVALESDEPGALLVYRWDNSSEASYIRPLTAPEGLHRLYFRAQDLAGNNGSWQDLLIRVDTKPPDVSVSVEPRSPDGKSGWYLTRPTVTIDINDSDPAAFALYGWDGAELRSYLGPLKVPEGVHTLRYTAKDTRGNNATESARTFHVDSSPPVTEVSISPADMGGDWYRASPVITLTTDATAEVWSWWDDDPPMLYPGPVTASEGEHTLNFQSRNAAGNSERPRSLQFRVDTAPPVASIVLSAATLTLGDILSVDAGGSSDSNGIDTYSIDFGDGSRKSGPDRSWEHQYDSTGTYAIVVKVKDLSGSWSDPAVANMTVLAPPKPPAPPSQKGSLTVSPAVLGGLALAVILVAASAFIVRRRHRRDD